MIECNRVTAGYGSSPVIHNVDLDAGSARAVGIRGANGSGKSTLLRALVGLAHVSRGTVLFDEVDVTRWNPERRARLGLAMMPQTSGVFQDLSVRENIEVASGLGARPSSKAWDILRAAGHLADQHATRAGHLSGGESRILALAMSVARQPKVLLLDEPLAGLNSLAVSKIVLILSSLVEDSGCQLVIVEHLWRPLSHLIDRFITMEAGVVIGDEWISRSATKSN